jgi:hypothetical protein
VNLRDGRKETKSVLRDFAIGTSSAAAGDDTTVEDTKERQMKTSEDVLELALYSNDCCDQELIFDVGDTFCRCPKCRGLCDWSLESKITDPVTAESDEYINGYAAGSLREQIVA